jgi:hypothetical protein
MTRAAFAPGRPTSGTVRIAGRAMRVERPGFGPHRVRILHGTKQIWPRRGWAAVPMNDLTGASTISASTWRREIHRFVLDRQTSVARCNSVGER